MNQLTLFSSFRPHIDPESILKPVENLISELQNVRYRSSPPALPTPQTPLQNRHLMDFGQLNNGASSTSERISSGKVLRLHGLSQHFAVERVQVRRSKIEPVCEITVERNTDHHLKQPFRRWCAHRGRSTLPTPLNISHDHHNSRSFQQL